MTITQKLAALSGRRAPSNILRLCTIREDGALVAPDGAVIGRYNMTTGIGWCNLRGYLRMLRASRNSAPELSVTDTEDI